jgi:hypothetical protein
MFGPVFGRIRISTDVIKGGIIRVYMSPSVSGNRRTIMADVERTTACATAR